jgi:hypothetical protein
MNEEVRKLLSEVAISIPDAGRVLNLGKNKAYEAAKRGEIETIEFGKRKIVPTAFLRKKLGLQVLA